MTSVPYPSGSEQRSSNTSQEIWIVEKCPFYRLFHEDVRVSWLHEVFCSHPVPSISHIWVPSICRVGSLHVLDLSTQSSVLSYTALLSPESQIYRRAKDSAVPPRGLVEPFSLRFSFAFSTTKSKVCYYNTELLFVPWLHSLQELSRTIDVNIVTLNPASPTNEWKALKKT